MGDKHKGVFGVEPISALMNDANALLEALPAGN